MASQLTVDVSPSTLLTAPDSARGPLPTPLPIATDSTLVLGGGGTRAITATTTPPTITTSCVTAEPGGACNAAASHHPWVYGYEPSIGLAALLAALFLASLAAHIAQAAYFRKLKLAWPWPLLVGLTWAAASFSVRAAVSMGTNRPYVVAVSETLGILAPVWITLFHYALLGQMATVYVAPDGKVFRLSGSRIALAFACLSVEVFLLEGCGAVLLALGLGGGGGGEAEAADRRYRTMGARVMVAGFACQQAYMLVFAAFAARFHGRAAKLKREHYPLPMFRPWRTTLAMIYVSLALLTARNAFRLVQFAAEAGDDGQDVLACGLG
ncbi:hypothetical protein SLS62_008532 [Diatrype stigma]|uniref:Uncharacterized protein n=1 Tax=Diatrype stigma TaxID=117547 RepID=A0AAN9UIW3_9PEZI